jgi:hypothetical protein
MNNILSIFVCKVNVLQLLTVIHVLFAVLPDKDIIAHEQDNVTFRYKDSTINKITPRALRIFKFLLLILQHFLLKTLQQVRDYGLLSTGAKKLRLIIQLYSLSLTFFLGGIYTNLHIPLPKELLGRKI